MILVCSLLVLVVGDLAHSAEVCDPKLGVLAFLIDGHQVLPVGLDSLGRAFEKESRRIGLDFTSTLDDAVESPKQITVRVVFMPHDADSWGGNGATLGRVVNKDSRGSPVFLFYPAIERLLGKPDDGKRTVASQLHPAAFTRGLARIIIHEVIHVLLSDHIHDSRGIFAAELTRRDLLAHEFDLDADTRAALVARFCLQQ